MKQNPSARPAAQHVHRVEPAHREHMRHASSLRLGGIPCEVVYRGPDTAPAGTTAVSVPSDGLGYWVQPHSEPANALMRREPTWDGTRLPEPVQMGGGRGGDAIPSDGELQRVHRLLRGRYVWAVILALLLGGGGVYAGVRFGHKMYQSVGLITVVPVHVISQQHDNPYSEQFMDAQAEKMRGQHVMEMALDDPQWQTIGRRRSDEVEVEFAKQLDVTTKGPLLIVKFTDPDPQAAAVAVQTTLRAFHDVFDAEQASSGDYALQRLRETQADLSSRLEAKNREIGATAGFYGPEGLIAERQFKLQQLQDVERGLEQANMEASGGLGPDGATTRPVGGITAEEWALSDQTLAQKLEHKRDLQARLDGLTATGLGEKHQSVIQLRKLLEATENDINDRVQLLRTLQQSFQARVSFRGKRGAEADGIIHASVKYLNARKDALTTELTKFKDDIGTIEKLKLEEAQIRLDLNVVEETLHQWQVEKQQYRIEITDAARPLTPYRDTRIVFASAGGLGGALLGFGLVLALGLADRRIRTPADLKVEFGGRPVLGVLPRLPEDLSDPDQAAAAAHGVHEIRTLLQIWGRGQNHQVFGITSATAGSGKTSLTAALGVSFAAAGFKTLLIDCDLIGGGLTTRMNIAIRPNVGQVLCRAGHISEKQLERALEVSRGSGRELGDVLVELGAVSPENLAAAAAAQSENSVGLLEALAGEALSDCVAPTDTPGLWVLPLGDATAQHAGTLSTDSLQRVIAAARDAFDVVLVDTGPVPGSLEASVTASEVDAVVMTLARGDQRFDVDRALRHLQSVGARVAGIVFNRARPKDVDASRSSALSSARGRPSNGASGGPSPGGEVRELARLGPMAHAVGSYGPGGGNGSSVKR